MDLLIVTGIFPPDRGGPASYVPRMAAALCNRDNHVEVVCLSERTDADDSAYSFPVHRIRRSLFWPWRILLTVFTIWQHARRHDLVYVNGLSAEAAIAARLAGRPTVHKIVGDYAWERAVGRGWFSGTIDEYQASAKPLRLRLLDAIRTLPVTLATQVIVPSLYLRQIVAGWGIELKRIRVIYNAAAPVSAPDPSAAAPQLSAWSGKTLITVCRLVPWKRVDALIRLLAELPDTRLVIAGDGPLRADLEALAGSCGLADRVVFLGDVPQSAVRGYLQQADAFVLNSSYEGLPHVVLEAMSAGVPVIATAVGGTPEVVENEVTGLLLPPGDAGALRCAVQRLWRDPLLGRKLVAGAAGKLVGEFSFPSMLDATETVLLFALEPARPAQSIAKEGVQ